MGQDEPAEVASLEQAVDRRKRVRQTVNELLTERQQVLVAFCDLAGITDASDRGAVGNSLQSFCQILVDYTALGHFELYERIVSGNERRRSVTRVAEQVYPSIAHSTDLIVDFNDKYDASDDPDSLSHLESDLSALGETLAERFELEDRLLQSLTTARSKSA